MKLQIQLQRQIIFIRPLLQHVCTSSLLWQGKNILRTNPRWLKILNNLSLNAREGSVHWPNTIGIKYRVPSAKRKKVFFTNQIFHLKKENPKQWYREVLLLAGMNDSPLKLTISNCAPDDDKGIANAINQKNFSGEPDVASSEYHCITCIPVRSRNPSLN